MKKYYIILSLLVFFSISTVKAEGVSLNKCIDGDTVSFKINNKIKKVRLLGVDAPEIKHGNKKADPYGDESRIYTCMILKTSSDIKLEYDDNSDKTDKYGRDLAWVFVNGDLLQEKLVKKGLAKVAYLYGDYKYTDEIKNAEKIAKEKKLKIWSDYKEDYTQYYILGILFIIVIIICIFDKKYRKKTVNNIKRKVYNKTSKELDKFLK